MRSMALQGNFIKIKMVKNAKLMTTNYNKCERTSLSKGKLRWGKRDVLVGR